METKKSEKPKIVSAQYVLDNRINDDEFLKVIYPQLLLNMSSNGSASAVYNDDIAKTLETALRKQGWKPVRCVGAEGWHTIISCKTATEGTSAFEEKQKLLKIQKKYIANMVQDCLKQQTISFVYRGELFPEVMDMLVNTGWDVANLYETEYDSIYVISAYKHPNYDEATIIPYGDW